MLKWFGGGGGGSSSHASTSNNNGNGGDNLTHVGKVFIVNEHQVVVEELIAEGGFAVVYQARSLRGQIYALKRMAVNNDQDLHLAKQEIAITKALSDCPNSVTYISSSIESLSQDVHEVLILLELYTGKSVVDILNSRLSNRSTLSEGEVLKIFSDVVVAVGRLHHRTKPIIHRDLKIENILSDSRGVYILCDYGSCTVKTMHPETMGASQCEDEIARFTTLAYRAPEMVSLYSGKTISTKADIWALGCLLHKLCFMTTPFGEQPLAIVSAQYVVPENSPYSNELHSLMRYMLEVDPEKRPTIWQVNEVICRMMGRANTLPNVFRSPNPPATLPPARKVNDTSLSSKSSASNSKPLRSTPANAKSKVVGVTTTSISSRERPRARGINQTHPTSESGPHPPVISHTSSYSPPLQPRPSSRDGGIPSNKMNLLRIEDQASSRTKSWDSGLDMFGAVPFNNPTPQEGSGPTSPLSTNLTEVRRDLFGSAPFSSFASSPLTTSTSCTSCTTTGTQQTSHSHGPPANTQQATVVDEFGAPPFVTCS